VSAVGRADRRAHGRGGPASRVSPRLLIALLGAVQIVSWGSLYYSFSLFVLPLQAEFGWSLTAMNGALTAALMVAGLCAYPVGALIDRHGGRRLMTAGALGAAVLLAGWSTVTSLTGFYLVWIGLGVCMSAVLYEPLFVVLTYHFREHATRAITALTLIAGFASTVFMPLIETLLAYWPWRTVALILAAFNLLCCVPVYAWLLPAPPAIGPTPAAAAPVPAAAHPPALRARLRDPVFCGLTLWFTAYSGTASGLMFQLVPYLKSFAVDNTSLLITVALVGPAQVAGRALLMLAGERGDPVKVGAITTALTPLAVLVLVLAPPALPWLALFAVTFGLANGITTILRGTVPAAWLGHAHFGKTMGLIAAPMMIAAALAPLATAAIWSASDNPQAMQWAVFAFALFGPAGYWLAVGARARRTPD